MATDSSAPVSTKHSPLDYALIAKNQRLHRHWVASLAFSPDGKLLATASADGAVFVVDVFGQHPVLCLSNPHPFFTNCLHWPSQDWLVLGRSDGVVQVVTVDGAVRPD